MELFTISWWGYIVAGLGIFLFGIIVLGAGLKNAAGDKIKSGLDRFASNPIKAALIGAFVTIFLHSAGTTTLTIGLVQSGLMSLTQAAGIIMGANIGTTITSLIIGLNVSVIGPFILAIGAFIGIFSNKPKVKYIGDILFGLGAVFFGMTLMESSLKPLANLPEFINIIKEFGKTPLLGLLVGTLGTIAINSSAAFIGIVQSLYLAAEESGFTLSIAIPLILGSNIGTTFTSIIASMGGSKEAKKTALIHVFFNIIGTILFIIFLNPYVSFIQLISNGLALNPKLQVAVAHIIFNVITTIILLPCSKFLVKFVNIILPESAKEKEIAEKIDIDLSLPPKNIIQSSPSIALDIAKKKVIDMGKLTITALVSVKNYLEKYDEGERNIVIQIEEKLDTFDRILLSFLNSMERTSLNSYCMRLYSQILKNYKDIERIGDHCENLIEYIGKYHESKEHMSAEAKKDLEDMLNLSIKMAENTMFVFASENRRYAQKVFELETQLDKLDKDARERHVQRFLTSVETGSKIISSYYVDMTGNIERIGDHLQNIAETSTNLFSPFGDD